MGLEDIYFAPAKSGQNNSGRQATLGFSVWRRSDNLFLDAVKGIWGTDCIVNPLQEQGRSDNHGLFQKGQPNLRGLYLPEYPVEQGPEPLNGDYVILYHDRQMDKMIIGTESRHYTAPPPPVKPTLTGLQPTAEHTLIAGLSVGMVLGLLVATAVRI